MKKLSLLLLAFVWLSSLIGYSQSKETTSVYNPEANAFAELTEAIELATKSNKHILVFIGGNWCPWCVHLDAWIKDHPKVDSLIQEDYVSIKVNYSREVPNERMMERLNYPNRFGFPVIVILESSGRRIHTQNSAYLEEGKSYDEKKMVDFLKSWNVAAVNPKKKP